MKSLAWFYAGTISALCAAAGLEWGADDAFKVFALGSGFAMLVSLITIPGSPKRKTQ